LRNPTGLRRRLGPASEALWKLGLELVRKFFERRRLFVLNPIVEEFPSLCNQPNERYGRSIFLKNVTTSRLFVAEGDNGVNLRSAPRGYNAGDKRDSEQGRSCGHVDSWSRWLDPVKQRFEQAAEYKRQARAGCEAQQTKAKTAGDDHTPDVFRTRAKRHAHANFARALRHGVRQHAVNSNARQDQRQPGKNPEKNHRTFAVRYIAFDDVVHASDTGEGLLRVYRPHGAANRISGI
jgi:hypothetical protein